MGGCQLDHWARTGEFVPREAGDRTHASPSPTTENDDPEQQQQPGHAHGLEDTSGLFVYLPDELVGEDDDVLIPSAAAIDRTFHDARATWRHFVREAEALPPGTYPECLSNPYIMLKDVPALPRRLPAVRSLTGQPVWHVPDPEQPPQTQTSTTAATAATAGRTRRLSRSESGAGHGRRLARADLVATHTTRPKPPITRSASTAQNGAATDRRKTGEEEPQPFGMQDTFGMQAELVLECRWPIECRASASAHAPLPAASAASSGSHSHHNNGHLVLTLAWSYILSVRLLEIQRRPVVYHMADALQPVHAKAAARCRQEGFVVLNLAGRGVSPALVRWVCVLLSPRLAWRASDGQGGVPPWASVCVGDVPFAIAVDDKYDASSSSSSSNAKDAGTAPPTSAQAAKLLAEFCLLFGLDGPGTPGPTAGGGAGLPTAARQQQKEQKHHALSPPTAAFLAALALPFYRAYKIQPQLPIPRLRRKAADATPGHAAGAAAAAESCLSGSPLFARIRQYTADLGYFMTLSNDPGSVGSILWSVFWQPDVECNVVSPWLAGIADALRPLVEARDLGRLVQVFAVRRPRVAIWWLALALLGGAGDDGGTPCPDPSGVYAVHTVHGTSMVDWVARYLGTLEERYGYGTMATPSLTASAWTGVRHGYTDGPPPLPYKGGGRRTDEPVSRADLLWHRYNFRLREDAMAPTPWRPFGSVSKEEIEPDIWPWLEHGCRRQYVTWVWWVPSGATSRSTGASGSSSSVGLGGVVRQEERGFRRDTGRFVSKVPDRLDILPAGLATAAATSSAMTGLHIPNGSGRLTPNSRSVTPNGRNPPGSPNTRLHPPGSPAKPPASPSKLSRPAHPPGSPGSPGKLPPPLLSGSPRKTTIPPPGSPRKSMPPPGSPRRSLVPNSPRRSLAPPSSPRRSLVPSGSPRRLDPAHAEEPTPTPTLGQVRVRLGPSRSATLRMARFCMEDMTGDIDTSLAILNGIRGHKWLLHEKGFD